MPYIQYKTQDGDTVYIEVKEPFLHIQEQKQAQNHTNEQEFDFDKGEQPVVFDKLKVKVKDGAEIAKDVVVKVAHATFDEALDIIKANANAFIRKIKEIPVSDRPDEMQVSFGLTSAGEAGNDFVVKAGVEANYTVTLTWKKENGALS